MVRAHGSTAGVPPLVIVELDGLPYVAADWLELRLYRDLSRMQRWEQEARRVAQRTDRAALLLHAAYLWHALQAAYRVEKWRRCLAMTQTALMNRQRAARVEFGLLVRERRLAAGMNLRDLASRAGVDHKTIFHIETASFPPSLRVLQAVVAVPELNLRWSDVDPGLLEKDPSDGRKHRRAAKASKRRRRQGGASARTKASKKLPAAPALEWTPLELSRPDHDRLAKIIRQLRQRAGLTRSQLARETSIRAGALKHGEMGKKPFMQGALCRLLRHPSMRDVPTRAAQEGINLDSIIAGRTGQPDGER